MSHGLEVPTLTFQANGIPTIESWARYNKTFPDLKDFTICTYMKILKGRTSYDTLVSYAVPLRANEIYIGKRVSRSQYNPTIKFLVISLI